MKLLIHGEQWHLEVLEDDAFSKKFGDGDAAVTIPSTRSILFCEDEFDRPTVIHELVHAYYSYLCLSAASLETDQIEEIVCEMFAKHGANLMRQANAVYKKLKT